MAPGSCYGDYRTPFDEDCGAPARESAWPHPTVVNKKESWRSRELEEPLPVSENNKQLVERMWKALAESDWETLTSCMHADIHYVDVPSGDPGAHGPENCVKRLSIAWDHLEKQEQTTHQIAADGDVVFLEHTEKWTFKSGETCEHTFVTVHEIRDGLIYRWRDYWDMNKFVSQFPGWFLEEMAKKSAADFS